MIIKKISIHNMFGIKNYEVDFKLKNIPKGKTLEDQVVEYDDNYYALIPSFLGKNAIGKTSFIKAVSFALDFANHESFIKNMLHFKKNIYRRMRDVPNAEEMHLIDCERYASREIINDLFFQISHVGSEKCSVNIEFDDKRFYIELTSEGFYIRSNNYAIDINNFLDDVRVENHGNVSFLNMNREIKESIEAQIKKRNIKFDNIYHRTILGSDSRIININDIFIKRRAQHHLNIIIREIGFDASKILLKKIDENIRDIDFDVASKKTNIYLKGIEIFPITASNLSFGTQKIMEILANSFELFKKGGIYMVDEIENGLHLSLISLIINFYQNPQINLKEAQFLFTTHNPLIFKNKIVMYYNVFLNENSNFINIKKSVITNRTNDQVKAIDPKNYYNDLFWLSKQVKSRSTVNNLAINQIIDMILRSDNWQQK